MPGYDEQNERKQQCVNDQFDNGDVYDVVDGHIGGVKEGVTFCYI